MDVQIFSKSKLKYFWMITDGTTKSMHHKDKPVVAHVSHTYRMTTWPDAAAV